MYRGRFNRGCGRGGGRGRSGGNPRNNWNRDFLVPTRPPPPLCPAPQLLRDPDGPVPCFDDLERAIHDFLMRNPSGVVVRYFGNEISRFLRCQVDPRNYDFENWYEILEFVGCFIEPTPDDSEFLVYPKRKVMWIKDEPDDSINNNNQNDNVPFNNQRTNVPLPSPLAELRQPEARPSIAIDKRNSHLFTRRNDHPFQRYSPQGQQQGRQFNKRQYGGANYGRRPQNQIGRPPLLNLHPPGHDDNNNNNNRSFVNENEVQELPGLSEEVIPLIQDNNKARVPRNIQETFKRILISNEDGILASTFPSEFRNVTGQNLDLKSWGMFSVVDLALSHPTIFHIEKLGNDNILKLVSISQLVPEHIKNAFRQILDNNPQGVPASKFCAQFKNWTGTNLDFTRWKVFGVVELAAHLPEIFQIEKRSDDHILKSTNSASSSRSPEKNENNYREPEMNYDFVSAEAENSVLSLKNLQKHDLELSRRDRNKLKQSRNVFEANDDYIPLNVRSTNPRPERSMPTAFPRPKPSDPFLAPSLPPRFNTPLFRRIIQILSTNPRGIFLYDFMNLYAKNFRVSFNPQKFGFRTALELFDAVKNFIEVTFVDEQRTIIRALPEAVRLFGSKSAYLRAALATLKRSSDNCPNNPLSGPIRARILSPKIKVPSDAIKDKITIPKQQMSEGHDLRSYFAVFISHIINPNKFWVQLRGVETSLALDNLMDDINKFYGSDPKHSLYLMPKRFVNFNVPCIAQDPVDKNWYRAVVTGVEGGSKEVDVSFIDFGSNCKVLRSSIHFMRTRYAGLPSQALGAELACISPAEGAVWGQDSIKMFQEMCPKKAALMALLDCIKDETLSICICDTSSDVDYHINDKLVALGFAKRRLEHDQDQISNLNFAFQAICNLQPEPPLSPSHTHVTLSSNSTIDNADIDEIEISAEEVAEVQDEILMGQEEMMHVSDWNLVDDDNYSLHTVDTIQTVDVMRDLSKYC